MNYQQDWIMRQIEVMMKFVRSILTGERLAYHSGYTDDTNNELLKDEIEKLIKCHKFNEAEAVIFEKIEDNSEFDIEIAFGFYEAVNSLSDSELDEAGFSRERISEGIKEACLKCNVIDPDTLEFLIRSPKEY